MTSVSHTFARRLALLVDDDPDLLDSLRRLLAHAGLEAHVATNGLAALTMLEDESYDVVVSDYRMPSMDGVRLLDAVAERWPRTSRVLLTGVADSEVVWEAGRHKVLSKGLAPDLVVAAILREAKRGDRR